MTTPGGSVQFVVRAATVADAPGLGEVHVASWRAAYPGLMPKSVLDGLSVERSAAVWARGIAEGNLDVSVAVAPDGTVGGFIATGASRDDDATATVGELIAIYLRADLWDQGIGRALHAAGIAVLAQRFAEATLWVLDSNARARAFYERNGWQPDGKVVRATIREAEVDEMRYRRPLSPQVR